MIPFARPAGWPVVNDALRFIGRQDVIPTYAVDAGCSRAVPKSARRNAVHRRQILDCYVPFVHRTPFILLSGVQCKNYFPLGVIFLIKGKEKRPDAPTSRALTFCSVAQMGVQRED